jgi:aryl-alcohol dehydrogenase-like predicted oxidoreductase
LLGDRRKQIVLATKFGMDMDADGTKKGGSRRYIIEAVEASLKRMKTDWIDLYQIHRPDPLTPIEETLRALEDLIRQGKVRYIGCSNLPSWQVADAYWTAKTHGIEGFASCQDEYSLMVRGAEKELIPAARHFGMGLLPYFPLANGLLTGKYKRNAPLPEGARMTRESQRAAEVLTEANWEKTEKLTAFCEARGKSLVELAFSWLAAQPVVSSVIAGATKPEQVEANVKAAGWALSAEELAEIDAITK